MQHRQKQRYCKDIPDMQIDNSGRMYNGPQEVAGGTGQDFKDLRENKHIFCGAMILLTGDFRQTLPVIPRSTDLWRHVKKPFSLRVFLQQD